MTAFIAILTERSLAKEMFRLAVEAYPNGIMIIEHDGKMAMANAEIEQQFGYCREEIVGQKVKSIIPKGFAERLIASGLRSAADAPGAQ